MRGINVDLQGALSQFCPVNKSLCIHERNISNREALGRASNRLQMK